MTAQPYTDELVDRLARANRVCVLTGAGISAESGIATFRDPDGLWAKFKPQELANVKAFLSNPELVQGWYQARRNVALEAQPNAGHMALVDLASIVSDFTLVTQNVDNLHTRAGSKNVLELHGNIARNYCIDCNQEVEDIAPIPDGETLRCTACNGLIRPDVVWFGEMLPDGIMDKALTKAKQADVVLSIGTSAVVYPAAYVPLVGREHGAYVAEINIEASDIASMINESVLGPSGKVLPQLVEAVRTRKRSGKQ